MKVFVDANVLVSVLNKEYPEYPNTSRLLSLAGTRHFELFTSPICLAIAYYMAENKCGSALAKSKIELLVQRMRISGVNQDQVLQACRNKRIIDFEYGLEYYSAKAVRCQCIVTNDLKDFYFSDIEVLKPADFLLHYAMPKLKLLKQSIGAWVV